MRKPILIGALLASFFNVAAQIDSTDTFDYSKFGDAEGVKRFCNQKVVNQTPTRIVSIGYDRQSSFEMPSIPVSAMLPAMQNFSVKNLSALRAQVNIPVVSTNKVIWQVGANYWGSRFNLENPGSNLFAKTLQSHFLASAGVNSTLFKPLNEKNF